MYRNKLPLVIKSFLRTSSLNTRNAWLTRQSYSSLRRVRQTGMTCMLQQLPFLLLSK